MIENNSISQQTKEIEELNRQHLEEKILNALIYNGAYYHSDPKMDDAVDHLLRCGIIKLDSVYMGSQSRYIPI